ncbi:hypothetical protein V2G26_014646 [Clonostachys chloroleuca]
MCERQFEIQLYVKRVTSKLPRGSRPSWQGTGAAFKSLGPCLWSVHQPQRNTALLPASKFSDTADPA